ncbi:hypothetical protein ABPG77_005270 [Micractinium sp. CCAP 211/92]
MGARRVSVLAAALAACLALAWAQGCYKADQQVNVRSKADVCSSATGVLQPGDIIVSGALNGNQGYVDLMSMTQTSCPSSEPSGSTCYKADTSVQTSPVQLRAKADSCSSTKGSLSSGDVVRAIGSPTSECYTWAQMSVVSGGLTGTTGYVNLDAMSGTACPTSGGGGGGGGCKNNGEQCNQDSDCCQLAPGMPAVKCASPAGGGPKVCSGGAVVSSMISPSSPAPSGSTPTGVATPSAASMG